MFDARRFVQIPFSLKLATAVVLVSALLAVPALTPAPALAWQISANCDAAGDVVGTVGDVSGPFPSTFDVFVEDHSPVDHSWADVPGSRVTVVATSDSVDFGPLNISGHRVGADLIRIEESATEEHSTTFALCFTPTAAATATLTAAPETTRTALPTNSPPATSTTVATTGGLTNNGGSTTVETAPSSTSALVPTTAPPKPSGRVLSIAVRPASGVQPRTLPSTGTGPEDDALGRSLFALIVASLAVGGVGVIIGERQRR